MTLPSNPSDIADAISRIQFSPTAFAILLLSFGTFFLFVGRRLFKWTLSAVGFFFVSGFVFGLYVIAVQKGLIKLDGDESQKNAISWAVYAYKFYKLAMGCLGFLNGFGIVMTFQTMFSSNLEPAVGMALNIAGGVGGAALIYYLEKHLLIVSTAISGAIMLTLGSDQLIFKTGYAQHYQEMVLALLGGDKVTSLPVNGMDGLVLGLILLGLVVQYKWSAKNHSGEYHPRYVVLPHGEV